jgi:anaerobic C4-dicarboxylate transporter
MEKSMDVGGIVIGIASFLGMFVAAYICRLKPREPPEPVVVIRRDEDPGDPS